MEQRALDLLKSCILCLHPRNNYYVKTTAKQLLVQPVTLPEQSGDMMPDNTVPNFFAN